MRSLEDLRELFTRGSDSTRIICGEKVSKAQLVNLIDLALVAPRICEPSLPDGGAYEEMQEILRNLK